MGVLPWRVLARGCEGERMLRHNAGLLCGGGCHLAALVGLERLQEMKRLGRSAGATRVLLGRSLFEGGRAFGARRKQWIANATAWFRVQGSTLNPKLGAATLTPQAACALNVESISMRSLHKWQYNA